MPPAGHTNLPPTPCQPHLSVGVDRRSCAASFMVKFMAVLLAPLLALHLALLTAGVPARAEEPDGPTTSPASLPLLVVKAANGLQTVFDAATLAALPRRSFATSTLWTEGVSVFEGPLLRDVLSRAGIRRGMIRVTALNRYAVDIPVAEIDGTAPIVAMTIDGARFSIRDKGPLWIVYPYDNGPKYQNEVVYARSVWQMTSIELLSE